MTTGNKLLRGVPVPAEKRYRPRIRGRQPFLIVARLLVALVRRAREILRPDRQGCVKYNVWSIPLDYRTAVLEAHATSGRVGPAQRVKNQLLAGDA
jgi:hypothetical protein